MNRNVLSLDFETRSAVKLRDAGVHRYAGDPTTDILCMAYAFEAQQPKLWLPGEPVPEEFHVAINWNSEIRAWNAMFERVIWKLLLSPRYGFPEPKLEQYRCTMVEAAALGLPMGLGECARVLAVDAQKQEEGRRLIQQLSRPRRRRKSDVGDGPFFWEDPERLQRMYEYCMDDVRAERAVAAMLRPLSDFEQNLYHLDQRINDRGVMFDLPYVRRLQELTERTLEQVNEELADLTGDEVKTVTNHLALTDWLREQGVDTDNVRKDTVRELLESEDLDPIVRDVLQLRQDAGKASTRKLDAILNCVDEDDRARGLYQFNMAHTGRWAGRRVQVQNLTRPTFKTDKYRPLVMEGEWDLIAMEEAPLHVVSNALRSTIRAKPAHVFLAGDFAAIEAVVLAWAAGQNDLLKLLASGGKVYEDMAAFIYQQDIEAIQNPSEERTVGKGAILGGGFGMGADKFAAQIFTQTGIVIDRGREPRRVCLRCWKASIQTLTPVKGRRCIRCGSKRTGIRNAQVRKDMARAAINDGYRLRYPKIPQYWYALENAAIEAVRNKNQVFSVGPPGRKVRYTYRKAYLWCVLPSGRPLAYPMPKIQLRSLPKPYEDVEKLSLSYLRKNSVTRKWERTHTYGGHLTENIVQAIARDLLAEAMVRVEQAGYPIVLHTHDEIVSEVPAWDADLEEFLRLMRKRPEWGRTIPVRAEGWSGERYRK